jgi:lycopene beta-cyclase
MLFRAAKPNLRYKVMQRFYRLNAPLIGRFYAARSTRADRVRILVGKPPVGFGKAIACIPETGKA